MAFVSKWLTCGFFSSESAPYLSLWKCAFSVLPSHVYPTLPLLATSNYLQINFLFRWANLPTVWIWIKLSLRPQFLQQPLPSRRHRQAPFGEHCLWVSGHQTFQHQDFYREPHTAPCLFPAVCYSLRVWLQAVRCRDRKKGPPFLPCRPDSTWEPHHAVCPVLGLEFSGACTMPLLTASITLLKSFLLPKPTCVLLEPQTWDLSSSFSLLVLLDRDW